MTMKDGFACTEDEHERTRCLVEQGFTPALANAVLEARTPENLPLTIWIVDNSSSMCATDGNRLVETTRHNDVRLVPCSRWDELKETVQYHAQMSALLEAPTKFILLNQPHESHCPQEMSIAERGSDWVQADLDAFMTNFSTVRPYGVTPLTMHLRRIFQSIQHLNQKIVLVLATDGKPTDPMGYMTPAVDRDFENALRQLQSKAWVVVRLCTDESEVLKYYKKLDDDMELSLEVLDDYMDEAEELNDHNPFLTYGLSLHRCREMGMSYHPKYRWLDWLDERTLSRSEVYNVLQTLGLMTSCIDDSCDLTDKDEWASFCKLVQAEQKELASQKNEYFGGGKLPSFKPWNPIRQRPTFWIDIRKLRKHGTKPSVFVNILILLSVVVFLRLFFGWLLGTGQYSILD